MKKNSVLHGRMLPLACAVLCAAVPVSALDFSKAQDSLATLFESFIDDYEGETGYRSLLIPSGGRVESLGTAFTGLADDIGFFEYNPAASSLLDETAVALYHNAWIADSNLETLAASTRWGNFGAGAAFKCFYVPFTEYNYFGDRVASNYYSESTVTLNASYNFLSGYNFKGIAAGVNLKGTFRSIPNYTDNASGAIISGSGLAQSGLALMADVGMLMRFNFAKPFASRRPNCGFGIALCNAGAGITGFGTGIELDDPLPTRVSAGAFYRPINPLTLTAEVRRFVNLRNPAHSSTVAVAGGAEVQVTDFFSVMGGLLVSGGNPRISMGSQFELKSLLMSVNYTFDLTSSFNPVNHISLSAQFRLGDRGRSQLAQQVEQLYLQGVVRYAQNDLEGAEELWQQSADLARTELHQKYDPALEALESVRARTEIKGILDERERFRAQQTGTE